jgi:hypothetical protein
MIELAYFKVLWFRGSFLSFLGFAFKVVAEVTYLLTIHDPSYACFNHAHPVGSE